MSFLTYYPITTFLQMHVTEDIIERFFLKMCTEAEAQKVVGYLQQHPDVLDKYLSKAEWDEEITSAPKSEEFWDEIWQEIRPDRRKKTRSISVSKYAVAASLIVALVVFGINYFKAPVAVKSQQSTSAFVHRIVENTDKTIREVILADGSTVSLQPASKIEFDEPFQHNKRDIDLVGEAVFKVVKDKAKPFTVHTSHISTTALGTMFKVIANASSEQITVHLYEGKVVVKSSPLAPKQIGRKFYLLPGDELIFNRRTATAELKRRVSSKATGKTHLLVFDKEPLSEVFDQLASKYNVHIQYANDDFANMYYIGSFDETDSIQNILNNIIKLNGLTLEKNAENDYLIKKEAKKP